MRRHLASCSAVIATATASLGLCAGAAAGTSPATTGHAVTSASGLATSSGSLASVAAAPAKKPTATTPTKTTPTKTTPPQPSTAVKATARLYLPDAFFVHQKTLIVPDREMHVTGAVHPYVPGQTVTFRVFLGRKVIQKQTLRVKLSPNKKYGRFTTVVKAPRPGILHLQVVHKRTAQMQGFTSSRGVASLDTHAGRGSFPIRYPKDGRHAEANLGLQLLALIDHGKVEAIYPISSGKPSTPTI